MDKDQVLAGRLVVEAYRTAHVKLHEGSWHRGIPEEHTPLRNIMLKAFKELGFNTIQEFFDTSHLLNIQELAFIDVEDYEARATSNDKDILKYGKWQ